MTVQDTTPPVLTVPGPITIEATGPGGAVVTYSGVSATDTVSGNLTPSCSPASGSTFPVGTTTVNCTATDGSGNSTSRSFTVTVRDTTPPTLTLLGANPLTNYVNNYIDPGATATDAVWGNLTGSIQVSGFTNVAGRIAASASSLYARNLFSFIETLIDKSTKSLAVKWDDELVKATALTRDGAVIHPNFQPNT